MSLATWASPFEESHNNNSSSKGPLRGTNKAKTLKNRDRENSRLSGEAATRQLQELKESVYGEAPEYKSKGVAGGMGDFVPHPESAGANRRLERDVQEPGTVSGGSPVTGCLMEDAPCSVEGFDDLANTRIDDYYARAVPMYQENSVQSSERDLLLTKLNYMIHLLEEQRDERTGHVTEEIILYCFLGIFVIFIVDSFARVGKYVR